MYTRHKDSNLLECGKLYKAYMSGHTVTDGKMHAKSGTGDKMHLNIVDDSEKHMISKGH